MPDWRIKAALHRVIDRMPFEHDINYFLQRFVTRNLVTSKENIKNKIGQCEKHIDSFLENRGVDSVKDINSESLQALEIGTGWYPVVPIILSLRGFSKIYTYDISKLRRPVLFREMCVLLIEFIEDKTITFEMTKDTESKILTIKKYLDGGLDMDRLLKNLGVESRICDVSQSGLPGQSIDLILSNDVFEHIESSLLEKMCREFRRVIKSDGVMSHFIAIGDHFASFDDKITFINYLQYSEKEWEKYNTSMCYQNRLRLSEYFTLFSKNKFATELISREFVDASALEYIRLAPQFESISEDDLLTGNCWLRGYIDADIEPNLSVQISTHSE